LLEREVKLSYPTADAARTAIVAAGAVPLRPRRLQDDALFDMPEQVLRRKGCIVRVRTDGWSDGSTTTTLTAKGPVEPGQMKMREEHETRVEDGSALLHVLEILGLRATFRYQKFREEFSAPDLVIAIDETPVGTFVELEGGEDAIVSVARALGRTPADFIRDSYYRLFHNRREEFGLSGSHMLFSPSPGLPTRSER
jgi:adenylate cyclase, class 2